MALMGHHIRHLLGTGKRLGGRKRKLDRDEKGPTPPAQKHFKVEPQGSKATEDHQGQHLRI